MDDTAADDRIVTPIDRERTATDDSHVAMPDRHVVEVNAYQPSIDEPEVAELRPPVGLVAGAEFGIAAAVLYTASNIALRQSVSIDPFLVSAVKAAPTVIVLGPVLLWMWCSNRTIATSTKMVPRFTACALFAQFVGNAALQVALGVIGLAASIPITLGVMIIGGAYLGRAMLGEPVRVRTIVAMVTLVAAVVVLSLPGATERPPSSDSALPIWAGVMCAIASGFAYALFGVMMRQALTGGLSPQATMFISGIVGTVSLGTVALLRIDIAELTALPQEQWAVMALAGIFNFTAFVALSMALKSLSVVAVNLINASQVAMAATAGVILFAEPITWPLLIGIVLTFVGLMVLASRRRPATEQVPA